MRRYDDEARRPGGRRRVPGRSRPRPGGRERRERPGAAPGWPGARGGAAPPGAGGRPVREPADHPWHTWERGAGLLAGAGRCPHCRAPQRRCAFARAARLLTWILDRIGAGDHHLVCSVALPDAPLNANLGVTGHTPGAAGTLPEHQALVLCTVLAVGLVAGAPGGLVMRSEPGASPPGGPRRQAVRGWRLADGRLTPLGEAEVFAAYCTDPSTGDPLPPEPGVDYLAAPPPPRAECPGR
ncbi:hypothetical protein [Streptomyces profundus]|uniref:hypothetical protein n=1 Tax=Streptomyces profundus TaxID=2867410 RepID=UPI001D16B661|nr:hypothetical protein [Streptomyces sp. MA3_2.13]UED82884.1 hypothetical protein K4G22_00675 [Streptomyces sp. MA3_2.13]